MLLRLAMIDALACLAALMSAACASQGKIDEIGPAGAQEAITAWARSRVDSSTSLEARSSLIEPVDILYGDFTGDGAPDALAFAYFDAGGSGANLTVALFRNEDGRMTFMRTVDDVYGAEPRDATFSNGTIVVTTTMPNPGDPHCCPTGSQEWTIRTN